MKKENMSKQAIITCLLVMLSLLVMACVMQKLRINDLKTEIKEDEVLCNAYGKVIADELTTYYNDKLKECEVNKDG